MRAGPAGAGFPPPTLPEDAGAADPGLARLQGRRRDRDHLRRGARRPGRRPTPSSCCDQPTYPNLGGAAARRRPADDADGASRPRGQHEATTATTPTGATPVDDGAADDPRPPPGRRGPTAALGTPPAAAAASDCSCSRSSSSPGPSTRPRTTTTTRCCAASRTCSACATSATPPIPRSPRSTGSSGTPRRPDALSIRKRPSIRSIGRYRQENDEVHSGSPARRTRAQARRHQTPARPGHADDPSDDARGAARQPARPRADTPSRRGRRRV